MPNGVSVAPVVADGSVTSSQRRRHRRISLRVPMPSKTFRVAIVGRPTLKSTLFNQLADRRLAIVDDTPGARDWREADAPGRSRFHRHRHRRPGRHRQGPEGRMSRQSRSRKSRRRAVPHRRPRRTDARRPPPRRLAAARRHARDPGRQQVRRRAGNPAGWKPSRSAWANPLPYPPARRGPVERHDALRALHPAPDEDADDAETADEDDGGDFSAGRCNSPSSAGPTPASRRWSTACWARSGC